MVSTSGDDLAPDIVRDRIRRAILNGEYAPRQRLVEADLCERFGASRFVVRTALQNLAAQGLVEFQRNRGARVRDVSVAEAIEFTEIRMLIEGFVARRAAEQITKAHAAGLRHLLEEMRAAVATGKLLDYSALNVALHARLHQIAAHRISAQLLEQVRDLTARHDFTLSLLPGRSPVSLAQHEAIVAAVISGDADAAQAAMSVHLHSVIDALRGLAGPASPP